MSEQRLSHELERPSGRPRAMSETVRRQQIADAAAAMFARKGYWATTMDEVSRQAGMSKKTVYQLFSSKADIFDLLLRGFTEPFSTPFETAGRTPRTVLSEGLFRLATAALDDKQVEMTRVLIAETARPGDVADALERQNFCHGDWALKSWLMSQERLGTKPIDDPEKMASALLWAVVGDLLFTMLLRVRDRPCETEIAERVERVVDWFYGEPALP